MSNVTVASLRFPLFVGVCGLIASLLLNACTEAVGTTTHHVTGDKIQSVTLDARQQPPLSMLEDVRDLGATHITLIQFAFQPGYDVPEIRMNPDARWFTESDRGIRILARQADSLGMGLILKPHIWVGGYRTEGQARHTIGFDTEAQWQAWEAQYHAFLMHYAHLAEEVGATVLVVGTELAHVARTRPAFWHGLIADVRAAYGGKLSYAANWYEEYEDIPFWDALDYIGIQAYFELSKEDGPTVEMLRKGWVPYKKAMHRLAEKFGKPVLFTEIGYRNVPYAAAQPWRWPSRDEADTVQPDDVLQMHLYQAFFESMWHEPWFAGAVLWKWQSEARARRHTLGFTPQNKPAEALIARWFTQAPSSATR